MKAATSPQQDKTLKEVPATVTEAKPPDASEGTSIGGPIAPLNSPMFNAKTLSDFAQTGQVPDMFSTFQPRTRKERLELLQVFDKRKQNHDDFMGPSGIPVINLIRCPYEYSDDQGEEHSITRYLVQTEGGEWFNIFSDGMVRDIDRLIQAEGLPPWKPAIRFFGYEVDVGQPSKFKRLRFE